jgi:peptidyl-prolyl cis-trans isomerase C
VILDIAGESVFLDEFDEYVATSAHHDTSFLPADVTAGLFEQFIEERLLLRAAEDAGITVDAAEVGSRRSAIADQSGATSNEAALTKSIENQLLISHLFQEVVSRIEILDEEIETHYDSNRDFYKRPESVTVSEILVDEPALAASLREDLTRAPDRFEEVARQSSQSPEAARGGRLGSFARGELPPSIESVVFELKPGAISEVISTDFGYHVFRVHERREEESLPIEAVRDLIRLELVRQRSDTASESFLDELKQRYPVTVHREHLSFAIADWESAPEDAEGSISEEY